MADPNKVELALKEMSFCEKVLVDIGDNGVVSKIHKQRVFKTARHGVKIEVIIDEEIVR